MRACGSGSMICQTRRGGTLAALNAFLGLSAVGYPGPEDDHPEPHLDALPLGQLPPPLLAQVNDLLGRLGYPALVPA